MIKPVLKTFILLEALFLISSHVSASSSGKCCVDLEECFGIEDSALLQPKCPEDALEPAYEIFTRGHCKTPIVTSLGNMTKDLFTTKKYYFIVHGVNKSVESPQIVSTKTEFLKKDDATVILMDWRSLSVQGYTQSASNTRTAGAHLAKVIEKIRELVGSPYVWCLGHSLGAHVCGRAGRKKQINRITGLDPAGPLMGNGANMRKGLYADSAVFVDVIHTNDKEGTYQRLGHADFYCNEGRRQPACADSDNICHHSIALDYFTVSINNPCFLAKKCANVHSLPQSCTPCTSRFPMGYDANSNTTGIHDADPGHTGIFYLETNAESPYCKE